MNAKQRFFIGGLGALMPVLVSLLAIDIGAMLDKGGNLTTGNIVGFVIRYLILFGIGGFVAYLHNDERKPFKLFELGIAAPALLTSLITAQGLSAPRPVVLASGFLDDIFKGASGSVYREINSPVQKTRKRDMPAPASPPGREGAGLNRGKSESKPVSRKEADQKKKAISVKSSPMVVPKTGLAAGVQIAPKVTAQEKSVSSPALRSEENLRRRAVALKAQLRKMEQELRKVERALALAQAQVPVQ